jgi:NADH pyrophosphatase NudC (nudix superfamily)
MASEQRLIDANAIPWEEHYVPDLESGKQWGFKKELCVLKPAIDQMPTLDAVEVVHGRWVMKETMIKSPFAKNAYCSVCLEETSYAHNFCPNCGAKMDGERKDNERKAD